MNKVKLVSGIMLAFASISTGCNSGSQESNSVNKQHQKKDYETLQPTADKFVSSPIRNRLVIELAKPVSEVRAIIGDPSKMPAYSAGLNRVETKTDGINCTAYTCYFKPQQEGGQEIVHTAKMLWYAPNKGWASLDNEPNEFGLKQSLTMVTMEQNGDRTVVKWSMHFNSDTKEILQVNKTSLEQALADIGNRLVTRFGGRVVENYVEAL